MTWKDFERMCRRRRRTLDLLGAVCYFVFALLFFILLVLLLMLFFPTVEGLRC